MIEEKIIKNNGEILTKRYLRGKLLGKGAFAKCYEVTESNSKKVFAAKIINKNNLEKNKARQKVGFILRCFYIIIFPFKIVDF